MRILVACDSSQAVTIELRRLGHEAYSCDIQDCSGGHPEWHIKGDALELIKLKWDMIIAHPPCTYLTNAGISNFSQKWATDEYRAWRWERLKEAEAFFLAFASADCERIAIENPVGYMNTHYRKPDQIIHPYEFGHEVNKPTCLWLKGLPKLIPTQIVGRGEMTTWGKKHPRKVSVWYKTETRKGGETSKNRSKTFPGIARAMAEQWAGDAREENLSEED